MGIYNETMLDMIKARMIWKNRGGLYFKSTMNGYAHYDETTKIFMGTMGWKGVEILRRKFKICLEDADYFKLLKAYKLEKNWFDNYIGWEKRRLFEKMKPYVMLVKI